MTDVLFMDALTSLEHMKNNRWYIGHYKMLVCLSCSSYQNDSFIGLREQAISEKDKLKLVLWAMFLAVMLHEKNADQCPILLHQINKVSLSAIPTSDRNIIKQQLAVALLVVCFKGLNDEKMELQTQRLIRNINNMLLITNAISILCTLSFLLSVSVLVAVFPPLALFAILINVLTLVVMFSILLAGVATILVANYRNNSVNGIPKCLKFSIDEQSFKRKYQPMFFISLDYDGGVARKCISGIDEDLGGLMGDFFFGQ